MKKLLVLLSLGVGAILFFLVYGGGAKTYKSAEPPARPTRAVQAEPDTVDNFSYYLDERVSQEVRDIVVENRKALFVNPSPDFQANPEKYINLDYDEAADKAIVEILKNPGESMVKMGRIELDIVEKELDFLMDYLKYAYGAYEYYGGDEVFHPMKADILAELKAKGGSSVAYTSYENALYKHLHDAIIDCHFVIGQKVFVGTQRHRYFLSSEKYMFEKIGKQFYTNVSNVEYELISVDNEVPELLPYLDKNGYVTWVIGKPSKDQNSKPIHILLLNEENGNIIEDDVKLSAVDSSLLKIPMTMYSEYEKNGVRVAESFALQPFAEPMDDMFEGMKIYGQNIQGEDIVIVDLRDGKGGNAAYAVSWMEGYLGHEIDTSRGIFNSRRTETTYYTSFFVHPSKHVYIESYGTYENFIQSGDYSGWQGSSSSITAPNVNKDTLFIVLVDHNTMSSSENFVDYLRQTENVIVVGTNTGGLFMTGSIIDINLPYSKMPLRCGYNFNIEPDLSSIEAIGIQPDIWAPSVDSLDRVLKFIENNKLKELK